MPDEIRINRPQSSTHQAPAVRPESMPQEQMAPQNQGGSKMPWVILVVVVVVIVLLGLLFRGQLLKGNANSAAMTTAADAPSGYEAVFLTNGQVYFGKISNVNGDYVGLSDIFYLQVGPQQGSATAPGASAPTAAQQQVSLVKLGNELHGPVDFMHISRAQILFYEDLKESGQVVKAIEAYKANPSGTAPAPVQQQTPPIATPVPTK